MLGGRKDISGCTWIKQMALPEMSGPQPVIWRPTRAKRLKQGQFLLSCRVWHWSFWPLNLNRNIGSSWTLNLLTLDCNLWHRFWFSGLGLSVGLCHWLCELWLAHCGSWNLVVQLYDPLEWISLCLTFIYPYIHCVFDPLSIIFLTAYLYVSHLFCLSLLLILFLCQTDAGGNCIQGDCLQFRFHKQKGKRVRWSGSVSLFQLMKLW